MAYQPFPTPIGGVLSELTNGTTPVTLATAGVDYVVIAVRFSLAQQQPETNDYVVMSENISRLTATNKEVEFRFLAHADLAGNPRGFTALNPFSVLEGAVGDGTQVATGGLALGSGRYVPGSDERSIMNLPSSSIRFPAVVPKSLLGLLVARPLANNASVTARSIFREIEVDANGEPVVT